MGYLKVTNKFWQSDVCTGFGNRIPHWALAYKISEHHDFKFTILLDSFYWPETTYVDFPHTESTFLDDNLHGEFIELTMDESIESVEKSEPSSTEQIGIFYLPPVYKLLKLKSSYLESLIKDIQDKTLPTKKEDWNNCCLDMVSRYGFLNVNKHIKSSDGFFNYEKEPIAKWKYFIKDIKNIIENKDIDKIEIMNSYLIEDTYIYFDDFHTKNIAYKCNSLSSAIMLYMLTNKQHTKNCIKCNNLFFAKRSDTKYCNGNCARSYQREKRQEMI